MKTVFINPERCIGCLQCELACAVEHSASKDETSRSLKSPFLVSVSMCKRVPCQPSPFRTGVDTATPPRASKFAQPPPYIEMTSTVSS